MASTVFIVFIIRIWSGKFVGLKWQSELRLMERLFPSSAPVAMSNMMCCILVLKRESGREAVNPSTTVEVFSF